MAKKTIVISAVNLVEAGTLAILRDCMQYLSGFAEQSNYRIVALVYKKELTDFPHIEYIETQWPKKRWVNRLWYEYVSMKKISIQLGTVDLWFSLHDTTPSVTAKRRAVYCHNSFSFYKWKLHDLIFAPKIALFAIFTKYIYKTNIHKNDYLVVQQQWFRESMGKMFGFDQQKIIVSPPVVPQTLAIEQTTKKESDFSFVFAGSPNSHKNFEIICRAAEILEKQEHLQNFKIHITVRGDENKYARWLHGKWGRLQCLHFMGFVDRKTLYTYYGKSQCLIYPSKVESWGLPISEFGTYDKPMLLADLPYAHDTASGAQEVAFFDPDKPEQLAKLMKELIEGEKQAFKPVAPVVMAEPLAGDWSTLFNILLNERNPVSINNQTITQK